ncbi:hypothetical protein E4U46_003790, partial [Claviceps purpurea]
MKKELTPQTPPPPPSTAPLVWLHSLDPFRPSDLLTHVRHTTPAINQVLVPNLPSLTLDNLALLNGLNGTVALTSKDDVTTLPSWLMGDVPDETGRTANATACVVILVDKGRDEVDAFYFYFYSYDRGANLTQVVEPLNRLVEDTQHGVPFGDHGTQHGALPPRQTDRHLLQPARRRRGILVDQFQTLPPGRAPPRVQRLWLARELRFAR